VQVCCSAPCSWMFFFFSGVFLTLPWPKINYVTPCRGNSISYCGISFRKCCAEVYQHLLNSNHSKKTGSFQGLEALVSMRSCTIPAIFRMIFFSNGNCEDLFITLNDQKEKTDCNVQDQVSPKCCGLCVSSRLVRMLANFTLESKHQMTKLKQP